VGDDAAVAPGADAPVACDPAICSVDTCGKPTDACGETVQCARCRFDAEYVSGDLRRVALLVGDDVQIASGRDVMVRSEGWAADTVSQTGDIVELMAAPDGTRWVAFDRSTAAVAFETGGTWTVEELAGVYLRGDPSLALGADGTAYVAFGGSRGAEQGVMLGERGAGGWTFTLAQTTPFPQPEFVDLQIVDGEPWIAWADENEYSLKLTTRSGGQFVTETIDPNLPLASDHHLALGLDAQGRAHVVYRQDSPFFREIDHAVKDGGAWRRAPLYVMRHGERGEVRLAAAPDGRLAVGFVDDGGLSLATYDGVRWYHQPVAQGEHIDVGFDPAGTLHVAVSDFSAGVHLLTRDGSYPPGYAATCAAIAAAMCPLACACSSSDCCWETPAGTDECATPESFCEYIMEWRACGDASQDPALVDACITDAPTASCNAGTSHLTIPDSCPGF
jgi:hypothetical protein